MSAPAVAAAAPFVAGLVLALGGAIPRSGAAAAPRAAAPAPRFAMPAASPQVRAREDDRWLGVDKLKHFSASFALTVLAYAGSRAALRHDAALAVSISIAGATGAGKEVLDARRGRGFGVRDLAWDALGIAAGATLLASTR